MQLVNISKARLEKNKLIIDESVTLEEWKEIGQALKQVEGSVQFWIGDWARFGEKQGFTGKYVSPKVYDELEEITGYTRQTIQDFKSVSERTSSLRNEDASFNHHKEVASLPTQQQKELLDMAVSGNLSVRQLRGVVRGNVDEKKEDARALQSLNDRIEIEKELKEMASTVNRRYNKEQRIFLITLIKQ